MLASLGFAASAITGSMSFINYDTQDIQLKVVFYGPEGSGKTAALQHIYSKTSGGTGQLEKSGNAPADAYYDMLPLKLGDIRGFSTHIQLFTVPGATAYREARREILDGADGLVFMADSRPARMNDNLASIEELALALRANSYDPTKIPFVLACGHADAAGAAKPEDLAAALLTTHPKAQTIPVFAVAAVRGTGVFDVLKAISKLVLTELKRA